MALWFKVLVWTIFPFSFDLGLGFDKRIKKICLNLVWILEYNFFYKTKTS